MNVVVLLALAIPVLAVALVLVHTSLVAAIFRPDLVVALVEWVTEAFAHVVPFASAVGLTAVPAPVEPLALAVVVGETIDLMVAVGVVPGVVVAVLGPDPLARPLRGHHPLARPGAVVAVVDVLHLQASTISGLDHAFILPGAVSHIGIVGPNPVVVVVGEAVIVALISGVFAFLEVDIIGVVAKVGGACALLGALVW